MGGWMDGWFLTYLCALLPHAWYVHAKITRMKYLKAKKIPQNDHLCNEFISEMPATVSHFLRTFTINALQPCEWIQQLAARPPSRCSAGTRRVPAGTACPCSWDAHRRSRHLRALCRSGHRGCASARGRRACCPPPPATALQSSASPKPSASMKFPPARKQSIFQLFQLVIWTFNH